ncbi:MAG: TlyA family RNA methyltransferase [Firmicutes bacterium]|nr:TlyA family RNA methyltransferase [Bacillota bacterium]
MNNKIRLDILLFEGGYFTSREQARAGIMAGEVLVDGMKAEKAGQLCCKEAQIRLTGRRLPYVSRGGLKLARAIEVFGLDFSGKTVIDIGASTGGFCDCALQNGASKIYAVDVGYGQLAWKLRQDNRVTVLEKTNARYLDQHIIEEQVDIITADVSFISLTKALPAAIKNLLKEKGELLALIKPQFEAGRSQIGKKGVVRDKNVHRQVLEHICKTSLQWGLDPLALTHSPFTGPQGNIEYLFYALKKDASSYPDIDKAVEVAWYELIISGKEAPNY